MERGKYQVHPFLSEGRWIHQSSGRSRLPRLQHGDGAAFLGPDLLLSAGLRKVSLIPAFVVSKVVVMKAPIVSLLLVLGAVATPVVTAQTPTSSGPKGILELVSGERI